MENEGKRVFVIEDPACEGRLPKTGDGLEPLRIFLLQDGSVEAEIPGNLSGAEVYLLQEQDGREPWRDLAILCTAAEAAQRTGAGRITAVMPVWPMDWNTGCQTDRAGSLPLALRMLQSAGISRLVTLAAPPVMHSALMPLQVVTPETGPWLREILPEKMLPAPAVIASEPSLYENARALSVALHGSPCVYLPAKPEDLLALSQECSSVLVMAGQNNGRFMERLGKTVLYRTGKKAVLLVPQISDRDEAWLTQATELFERVIAADCTSMETIEEFVYCLPAWNILTEWITRDN